MLIVPPQSHYIHGLCCIFLLYTIVSKVMKISDALNEIETERTMSGR